MAYEIVQKGFEFPTLGDELEQKIVSIFHEIYGENLKEVTAAFGDVWGEYRLVAYLRSMPKICEQPQLWGRLLDDFQKLFPDKSRNAPWFVPDIYDDGYEEEDGPKIGRMYEQRKYNRKKVLYAAEICSFPVLGETDSKDHERYNVEEIKIFMEDESKALTDCTSQVLT
jgi:hypothetical protein